MRLGQLFLDGCIVCSDLSIFGTFLSIFIKLRTSRSSAGLSLQTLATLVTARILHIGSHFVSLHYNPAVLPWIMFPTVDTVNAILGIICVWLMTGMYYETYDKDKDNFGIQLFEKLELLPKQGISLFLRNIIAMSFLYTVVAVLAFFWYLVRRSHHSFLLSYYCCYYEVMCAMALLPQLWMFQKDKRVPQLLGNFVVLNAVSRACTLCFWFFYPSVYRWSYPDNRGIQMASEVLNILILADFLYYWTKSRIRGETEVVLGEVV
mmetsp:Transcript_7679/g.14347  ORF Transcript_7679/g.14347 Transcript_7679/m.14347 type:complete len:263 (-) Transcript_7679:52-840(-)